MDRVWRRRRLLRSLFSLLAAADLLFPEVGSDVPARLRLEFEPGAAGPRQRWQRTFDFPRPRRFDAVLTRDARLGLVELLGPGGLLAMRWKVAYREPATLLIETSGAYLRIGRHWRRLPGVLCPSVYAAERALGESRIYVELVVSHRLLGPLFGYRGTFELQ